MKTRQPILSLIILTAVAALGLTSCDTPQGQQFAADARKNVDAAMLGGLSTGTWSGAVYGLTAQEVANIRARQKASAKEAAGTVNP